MYGNGIVHTMTQNARMLPDTSTDAYGATKFISDSYDYDPDGNVAAITDGATGRNQRGNRDMAYDLLDRLTSTTSPMFGTATYAYDALDNLTRNKVTGGNQVRDWYYCYDQHWQLTNVKTGGCAGASVVGLGYDVQGNLSNKNGVLYHFDYGNRLREVVGRENHYWYDGYGRRVGSNRLVNGSSVRRSIYSQGGQLLFVQDQGEGARKEYIYLGGSLLAERALPNTGAATPETIEYQHTDALGSPVLVTSASRGVVERTEYEPYGQPANRALRNGPGYTGHHEDAATGLVYMQQRYYDPMIGRFLSVDPVTTDTVMGANFNRFKYAANNPYRFTDPDGRCESIATCQMEQDDIAVANGQMSLSELRSRQEARAGGAAIGVAVVVVAYAAIEAAPVIGAAAAKVAKSKTARKAAKEILCTALALGNCSGPSVAKDVASGEIRQESKRVEDANNFEEILEQMLRKSPGEKSTC